MNIYDQKTTQDMSRSACVSGGVSIAPRPPASPLGDAHSTFDLAREFSIRVQALADRAVGPAPETGTERGNASGSGVLTGLQESALSTRDVVSDGMRAEPSRTGTLMSAAEPGTGHNSAGAADQIKSFVERIERLTSEKDELAADIKEVFAEAKGNGFDVKVLRKVIARRKRDRNEVQEEDAIIALYEDQLGVFA